jgi:hypothetical protein
MSTRQRRLIRLASSAGGSLALRRRGVFMAGRIREDMAGR